MRGDRQPPFNNMPPMPPWMWFMPPGMQNQHGQRDPREFAPEIIVPARVNKAFEFYELITFKTMKRAAVYESGAEIIDGQELTDEEKNTLATACNMLSLYFSGKLKPDIWENLRVQALAQQVRNGGIPGRAMSCLSCQPNEQRPPNPSCPMCRGSGNIVISPMGAAPVEALVGAEIDDLVDMPLDGSVAGDQSPPAAGGPPQPPGPQTPPGPPPGTPPAGPKKGGPRPPKA
jgi:hypothetical protein